MTAARNLHASRGLLSECVNVFRYLTTASRLIGLQARLGAGQLNPGVDEAPARIQSTGFEARLRAEGWAFETEFLEGVSSRRGRSQLPFQTAREVSGQSDEKEQGPFRNAKVLASALHDISRRTARHAWLRDFALTLGGDHSVAVGSIHGLAQAWEGLGVVWVDAHADFNSPDTSPSGNFHGMPLAALCGAFSLQNEAGFGWFQPCLTPADVVLVGVRDIDAGEARVLSEAGVRIWSAQDVAVRGMDAVMSEAMAHLLANGERPLHLSFDIDALDAALVPGTGTPVPAGLSLEEGETLCRTLRESGLLVGMDLVEVNPRLEDPIRFEEHQGERTLTCARALILAALGKGPSR